MCVRNATISSPDKNSFAKNDLWVLEYGRMKIYRCGIFLHIIQHSDFLFESWIWCSPITMIFENGIENGKIHFAKIQFLFLLYHCYGKSECWIMCKISHIDISSSFNILKPTSHSLQKSWYGFLSGLQIVALRTHILHTHYVHTLAELWPGHLHPLAGGRVHTIIFTIIEI